MFGSLVEFQIVGVRDLPLFFRGCRRCCWTPSSSEADGNSARRLPPETNVRSDSPPAILWTARSVGVGGGDQRQTRRLVQDDCMSEENGGKRSLR